MYELHEHEQYFFDEPTLSHLANFVSNWKSPCCLCTPSLGKKLVESGIDATILDVDKRFSDVQGFVYYDIYKPQWQTRTFDLIICDPPFFNVSLSQLFSAIRMLSHHNFEQPILVSYLTRRSSAIRGTFAPFQLRESGYFPGYQTVRKIEKNEIEFFGNLSDDQVTTLKEIGIG